VCAALAASGLVAMASCFPDYTFLPAGAGDAGGDVALDRTTPPDATTAMDATPDAGPLADTAQAEAALPDAGPSDAMVPFDGGSFDFVVTVQPIHATLDYAFEIDVEEVSVARFKSWVVAGMPVPCSGTQPCALDGRAPYDTTMYWNPAWNSLAQSDDYMGGANCPDVPSMGIATYATGTSDADPVTCVNWAQAAAFCWSDHKRLPTTTEWYYVATGAGAHATEFPWGTTMPDCSVAILTNLGTPCTFPEPVGTTLAQISGVHDLIGDVSEWTWDSIDSNFSYPPDATDYAGRPFDGGVDARNSFWVNSSYNTNAMTLDSVASAGPEPQYGWPDVGFRCARTL
jgi:formylglycine-generating enzyme required for sulfatase activity